MMVCSQYVMMTRNMYNKVSFLIDLVTLTSTIVEQPIVLNLFSLSGIPFIHVVTCLLIENI